MDENGSVNMIFSDTGKGMTARELQRVMTPFVQGKDAMKRTDEGVGLGLPIVKSIVEAHNGTVKVESEPDVGTTVRILLPAR